MVKCDTQLKIPKLLYVHCCNTSKGLSCEVYFHDVGFSENSEHNICNLKRLYEKKQPRCLRNI